MQIHFLGTGGAFDPEYGNSAALVECNRKTFLIDCGFTTYASLKKFDLFNKIDFVLLTHLHNDHSGSLVNALLHYNLISNPGKKLKVVYPSKKFRKQIWQSLSFALIDTDDYVEWIPIEEVEEVNAIDTFGLHVEDYQTWGYYFREGNEVLVYSGDVGDGDFIFKKLKKKKITNATVFHEIAFDKVPGHTHYRILMNHLSEHHIYGYHCDPRKNRSDNSVPLVADHPQFLLPAK